MATNAESRAIALAEKALELVHAGKTEVATLDFPVPVPVPVSSPYASQPVDIKRNATITTHLIPLPSPPDSPQSSRPLTPSQEGSRALREAASLAPQNARVKEAFVKIHYDESLQPLLRYCRRYAEKQDVAAAKEARWYLSSEAGQVPPAIAEKCLSLVLGADPGNDIAVKDDLIESLLDSCLGARQYAAKQFIQRPSPFFRELFELGDGAALGITRVSLDEAAWEQQEQRNKCMDDVFQLFLAKLLELDAEYEGRAIKGLARHMAVAPERFAPMIDETSFEPICKLLDYRIESAIRGQAVLLVAKFLEANKHEGEWYIQRFIAERTKKHGTEDLVLAFSCAAEVFPIATQTIASLFLIDGFLQSLIPLLDKKSRPIKVEKAALDMLSAACIDSACRKAIAKYCLDWMHHVMDDKEDERHGQAAVILAKVQDSVETTGAQRRKSDIVDVMPTLKEMVFSSTEMDRRAAVEGLAYASMQPFAKEEIAYDTALLEKLFEAPRKDSVTAAKAYGALTLLDNLTRYAPKLSDEQQKMSQLKAYANASKLSPQPKPILESDDQVTSRCTNLIDAGIVPFLVALKASAVSKPLSPGSLGLMAQVLNNLSANPETRGRVAQQGSVPLLLSLYKNSTLASTLAQATAAHAIARILISVDPKLVAQHAHAVLPPLISLLTPSSPTDGSPRNYLSTFESLIALTNLVSNPTLSCGEALVRSAFSTLEDLLLHDNVLVRRAATELVCNLTTTCPDAIALFADGSPAASRRLHVLLALADSEDTPTRQAAGGALAGLTEFSDAVSGIMSRERGIEIVVGLCRDEDVGCVHRGVVCLANMEAVEGEVGKQAREEVRRRGGQAILQDIIEKRREREVLEAATEAMRGLMIQA